MDQAQIKKQQQLLNVASKMIDMAAYEPVRFQREVLNIKPDPWAIKATDAVFDVVRKRYGKPTVLNHEAKNFFTVRAMHGPGKTFWLASLIMTFGFAFPKARIPCIAPKMDQLKTRLWLELRKIRDGINEDLRDALEIQATTMKFFEQDDWVAFAQTATKAENLAGLHSDFMLVCVDEASGVNEGLWPTIFGAVSTGKVVILVIISNPTKNTGTFAESWLRPAVAKDFYQVAITLDDAPRVSRSWIESMRVKYGEASPYFRIRCLGEFADTGENQLIPLQWIMDAITEDSELSDRGDGSRPKLRVSIDVADGGEDETVITVARHWATFEEVLRVKRFSFPTSESPILAARAAHEMFVAWGGTIGEDEIVPDSLGVGAGTAGTLIDMGHAVITYKGGESSDDSSQWRNRRAQSYINLRNAFREKRLKIRESAFDGEEDREDFVAQLCLIERKPGGDRVEELMSKTEMKRSGIKSPDLADSLAMQYATQRPVLGRVHTYSVDDIFVTESKVMAGY